MIKLFTLLTRTVLLLTAKLGIQFFEGSLKTIQRGLDENEKFIKMSAILSMPMLPKIILELLN